MKEISEEAIREEINLTQGILFFEQNNKPNPATPDFLTKLPLRVGIAASVA